MRVAAHVSPAVKLRREHVFNGRQSSMGGILLPCKAIRCTAMWVTLHLFLHAAPSCQVAYHDQSIRCTPDKL